MKKMMLSVLSLVMISGFTNAAMACSQAPAAYMDSSNVTTVLSSDEFKEVLNKQMEDDFMGLSILKIELNNTVDVVLSNGCVIKSSLKYGVPTHPGLCPQFKGVKSNVVCE